VKGQAHQQQFVSAGVQLLHNYKLIKSNNESHWFEIFFKCDNDWERVNATQDSKILNFVHKLAYKLLFYFMRLLRDAFFILAYAN
jgi:hypothetical protein